MSKQADPRAVQPSSSARGQQLVLLGCTKESVGQVSSLSFPAILFWWLSPEHCACHPLPLGCLPAVCFSS